MDTAVTWGDLIFILGCLLIVYGIWQMIRK
jgi:hypothetical protein